MTMHTNEMIDAVTALLKARPLDGWEVTAASSRLLSIEEKEQKVDTFKCSAPVGVSIRVLKNGGMGFSYSTSMDPADLGRMVENALVGAETPAPDEHHAFAEPGSCPDIAGLYDEGLA